METPKRKMPLFIIGLIALFAIAIIGIIVDFVADLNGAVAIISVLAAFVVFAIFIIIDVIRRRVAEKKAAKAAAEGASQFNVPADQRFLRHSDQAGQNDFSPVDAYSGFDDGDEFSDGFGGFDDGFDDAASRLERMERESPSMVLRRRAAELRAAQEGVQTGEDDGFDGFDGFSVPERGMSSDNGENIADGYENAAMPGDAGQAVSGFAYAEETYGDDYAEGYDDADAAPEEYYEDEQEAVMPEEESFLQPEKSFAPQQPAAETMRPSENKQTTAAMTAGQTLEAFYEDMSDEDILYRDCVEVWAADAKPSVLRLMKLVEELDDKKAQVRFGRELEYVNAMIDRIYCFTQLEYVDELLELQEYNFAALVKECLKRFSPFFMEKRLGLLWKGLDVNVMTDKRWFIFALTQVIFNSVEFTPEGGKIAISAKKSGEYIDLMIDDSGKGVSPDELPCVFIAGYMGDDSPNEEGRRTGMGLFIAQSVLRKMGGDAFIESNYGKGTRVTLRVPAIKPPAK